MAYPRQIDDDALAEARREYETTAISMRALAKKYGVARNALYEWVAKQGWVKYRDPDREQQKLERARAAEVTAEVAAGEDRAVIKGLRRSVKGRRSSRRNGRPVKLRSPKKESRRKRKQSAPKAAAAADAVSASPDADTSPDVDAAPQKLARRRGRPPKEPKSAEILPFPGGQLPPKKPIELPLPVRTRDQRAKLKVELGKLRGLMTAQQLEQLDRYQQIIDDYGYLMRLYLAPQDVCDFDGLSGEELAEKIPLMQKAALSLLLPTERDTLSGALKTYGWALSQQIQLKRMIAGISRTLARDPDEDDAGEGETAQRLGTAQLRQVHDAMMLLTGHRQRNADQPRPPAPDSIEDLRHAGQNSSEEHSTVQDNPEQGEQTVQTKSTELTDSIVETPVDKSEPGLADPRSPP